MRDLGTALSDGAGQGCIAAQPDEKASSEFLTQQLNWPERECEVVGTWAKWRNSAPERTKGRCSPQVEAALLRS